MAVLDTWLSGFTVELALSPLPSSSGLTRGSTCQGREAAGIGDFHPFPPPQEHCAVDPRVKPEDDDRGEANIVSHGLCGSIGDFKPDCCGLDPHNPRAGTRRGLKVALSSAYSCSGISGGSNANLDGSSASMLMARVPLAERTIISQNHWPSASFIGVPMLMPWTSSTSMLRL